MDVALETQPDTAPATIPFIDPEAKEREIQDTKDRIHALFLENSKIDLVTDCAIYQEGVDVMRVYGRLYTLTRLTAWVYFDGFDLADKTVYPFHAHCHNRRCVNHEHIGIATSAAERQQWLARMGRVYGDRRTKSDGRIRRLNWRAKMVQRNMLDNASLQELAYEEGALRCWG